MEAFTHPPMHINRVTGEHMTSFKFLGSTSHRTSLGQQTTLTWSRRLTSASSCWGLRTTSLQTVQWKPTAYIAGASLPALDNIYRKPCLRRAITTRKGLLLPSAQPVCLPALWEALQESPNNNKQVPKQTPCWTVPSKALTPFCTHTDPLTPSVVNWANYHYLLEQLSVPLCSIVHTVIT